MPITSINNDANPYYFPADVAKEGSRYVRISNYLKVRVHDNGKVVPFKWYDQGRVMNVHGFIPFIKGSIGRYMTDDDDEIIMSPDALSRDWQGTTANSHDGGVVDYILEDQMFPQEGIFKGHFGLKDTSGNILTSVNIVFEVLGDDLRMGETTKFYSSQLDKMVNEFQVRTDKVIEDANNEYKTKTKTLSDAVDALQNKVNSDTTKLIADAREKYSSETQNAHDSLDALQSQIQDNRDEQAYLKNRLADTEDTLKKAEGTVNDAIKDLLGGSRTKIESGYDLNALQDDIVFANGFVPRNAPDGVSSWTYYIGFGSNPRAQIAIESTGEHRVWLRDYSGSPIKWGTWTLISNTTNYSNSDIQNMINSAKNEISSKTQGKVLVGYDVAAVKPIDSTYSFADRELVDKNVIDSVAHTINSIKGSGTYVHDEAVDLHKLFGDGIGITTYVCHNTNNLDTPSYYSVKMGTLIVLNFDFNAFTQMWFPAGASGKGADQESPTFAMRYGEKNGNWTPWAINESSVKHGGQ